ncbi:MAG: NAD(P)/FAD-dependent oxidoreductase [Syntrophorhabdaceae bacterium]|nr:NAD(P)/FAD-dependent oxidoreductase [Syntrophorhabdaceae bacterium]
MKVKRKKHILIGAGTAALCALKQIRRLNREDEIKLVSMEDSLPYSPTALPYIISGKVGVSDTFLVSEGFFKKLKVEFLKNRKVERIYGENKEIVYDKGIREGYDSLLIATGSEPVVPDIPGLYEGEFLTIRGIKDAQALIEKVKEGNSAIILGAGLIGMHIAQCLSEKNMKVKVVESLPSILPAYFDKEASEIIRGIMEGKGIECLTGKKATRIEWKGGKVEVNLSEGGSVEGDLLVVAVGVKPRTEIVDGSGIKIENGGIAVDDRMRTSMDDVYAAGDVASAKAFFTGENGLNPILPNAAEQGRVAGSNMVGVDTVYEGWIPMNTFSYFGHTAISVGMPFSSEKDEVHVRKINGTDTYRKLIFREDRLMGVTFIDTEVNAGVFNYLIRKKVPVGEYKMSLLEFPRETSLYLMQQAEKKETISLEE